MKKVILVAFVLLALQMQAQVPQINGTWKSSSGNLFQVEGVNGGFYYKNLATNLVISAVYIGNNYGVPTFRANFSDGSFQLYMIKSVNEITTSNSFSPLVVNTWTKVNAGSTNQNQYNNNQSNTNNNSTIHEETTCSVCNGTRYSNSVVYPSYYGTTPPDEWCNVCNEWRKPHTHKPCYNCGGRGVR